MKPSHLLLSIGPAWDLNDHVQHGLLLIGVERDVMERRDWDTVLFDVGTVVECVGLANIADCVRHGGGVCRRCRFSGGRREMTGDKGSTI